MTNFHDFIEYPDLRGNQNEYGNQQSITDQNLNWNYSHNMDLKTNQIHNKIIVHGSINNSHSKITGEIKWNQKFRFWYLEYEQYSQTSLWICRIKIRSKKTLQDGKAISLAQNQKCKFEMKLNETINCNQMIDYSDE